MDSQPMQAEWQTSIALEGPVKTGKTRLLVERAAELLHHAPSDSVLVLCSNYYRKNQFLEALQNHLEGGYAQLQVTTYSALVRNTLSIFWPLVEETLFKSKISGQAVIFPELKGFEASEFILKKILHQLKLEHPDQFEPFAEFEGSESSLVRQLIRRLRLRSENALTRGEMRRRSELIGEICVDAVETVLRHYDNYSLKLRILDNSKQIDVFQKLLDVHEGFQHYFTGRIQHLIVDDVDETIPAQQHFIKFLTPHVSTLAMSADMDGGTRRGYLNAYPYDWHGLKALKPDMQTRQLTRTDTMYTLGQQLLRHWIEPHPETDILPVNVDGPSPEIIWQPEALLRTDMLHQVVLDVVQLLQRQSAQSNQNTVTPGQIAIVMPKVDSLARLYLEQQFKARGILLQTLTGTQRPTDNPLCRTLLLLLQLVNNPQWQMPLSPMEFQCILRHGLKLHLLDAEGTTRLINTYRENLAQEATGTCPTTILLSPIAQERYQQLLDWLDRYQLYSIEDQLYAAFREVLSPHLLAQDTATDLQQLIRSLYLMRVSAALSSENNLQDAAREWLIQVKTGIVADTPSKPTEIDTQAVVLGTPQKMIDVEIERPIHLWLDIRSREWSRTDNAPLYNAWVHSVNWDGNTEQASDAFNQQLTRTRAGHITRTLMLYVGRQVHLYASELDDECRPQTGLFQTLLKLPERHGSPTFTMATLRADQARILDYQKGVMAIAAVPGAGKTFVNVQLLLSLISRGIPADRILVLTYMESAARTLLTRLRSNLPGMSNLPVVSTIHSLAFRIITEADHALYLGLDSDDIQMIDELESEQKMNVLLDGMFENEEALLKTRDVLKGINVVKAYRLTPEALQEKIQNKRIVSEQLNAFITVYARYQQYLKQQGKLDFSDLINKAITLLESFPDIREKYQSHFEIVIEDEAQDSSLLLQQFIALLTGKNGNLIRTGDTNQSITTSFSNADTSVFRNFITHCHAQGVVVEMVQSSRCCAPILNLANQFMDWAIADDIVPQAFHPLKMEVVPQKNPTLIEPIGCYLFESDDEEKAWMIRRIKALQEKNQDASIAVLVRSNNEVLSITATLQENGIKALSLTDRPELHPAFILIATVLQVLENPANTEAIDKLLQQLNKSGFLTLSETELSEKTYLHLLSMPVEQLENGSILQLYYNLQDLMRMTVGQDVCRLVVRVSDLFLLHSQQRSVGYLCALKAQEVVSQMATLGQTSLAPLEHVNQVFQEWTKKRVLPRAFKMLADIFNEADAVKSPFVKVLTLHKAKGQEFDIVMMPGLNENTFCSMPTSVRWNDGDKLELALERLITNSENDIADMIQAKKHQKVEEEARLIYVGITRARQALLTSFAYTVRNRWGKKEKQTPSRFFNAIGTILGVSDQQTRVVETSPQQIAEPILKEVAESFAG